MAALASTRFLVLLREFTAFRKISWRSAATNYHRQSRFLCHVAKEDGSLTLASLELGNKPRKSGKSKAIKLEGSFVTGMGQDRVRAVKNDKMKVVKEKKPAEIVSPLFSAKSFEELGLPDSLLNSLEREGFSVPTDVQSAAVPAIIKGHDAVIQSYTGSGKTLAYLLPILSEIGPLAGKSKSSNGENDKRADIQAMIVAPSRELGMQIVREVEKLLGPDHRRMVQQLVGGANRMRQEEALKKNKPAIVVGTPGRIAEISKGGKLHTHGCRFLVLDEVDELLSFNFREDIHRILEHVGRRSGAGPKGEVDERANRQTILVSATVPFSVIRAAKSWSHEPVLVQANKITALDTVQASAPAISLTPTTCEADGQIQTSIQSLPPALKHYYCISKHQHKVDALRRCVHALDAQSVIAFMNHSKQLKDVVLFQEMIESRPLPTLIDFSKLFSGIARTRQYDLVLGLCKKMELNGISHNMYTLNIMINCFSRCCKTCLACSVLGKILKLGYEPDTTTFNTLVNGLCLEGKVSEAVVLASKMVENGCQPDVVTYGSIVNGICKSGDTSSALDLLRRMEERDIKADVFTYTTIIDSLCRDGSMDAATKLFNEMETKGIKSTVVTYNSLIGGFCRAGQWNDGVQLLKDMISKNIIPNVVTFNVLIDVSAKEGKLKEAKEYYEEMITRGVSPNIITYNSLIGGFCMQKRLDEANKMLDLMVRNHCDPDIVTYNSLLKGYCNAKKVDDAMKLFREVSERGIVVDTVAYSILVQGFCESGRVEIAEELFQEMVSLGVLPDVMTYGILLDGLCDNGKLEKALEIFGVLQKSKMDLGIVMYTIIIEGMCKGGKVEDAWTLKGVKPNVRTYTVMISGLCKKGSLSEANVLLRKMEEDGNAPNDCTYNRLIRAHLKDKDLAGSARLIEEMKRFGFSADASTFKMVVDMLSTVKWTRAFLICFLRDLVFCHYCLREHSSC